MNTVGNSSSARWSPDLRIAFRSVALLALGASVARTDPVDVFRDIGGDPVTVFASIVPDNTEAWRVRWKAVEEADVSVDAACFSLRGDVFGMSFLGLLLEKAGQGVTVRLLVDSKSSPFFTTLMGRDYLQELAAHPNIRAKTYNPFVPSLCRAVFTLACRKMLACSHAKLLIVDGDVAVTGGRNIGLEYYADPADLPRAWRDTDAVFRGNGIGAVFQPVFDAEFTHANNRTVRRDLLGNWDSKRDRLLRACAAMRSWLSEGAAVPVSEITLAHRRALEARTGSRRDGIPPMAPCGPDMCNREIGRLRRLAGDGRPAVDASPADPESVVKVFGKQSFAAGIRLDGITDNLVRLIDGTEEELVVQNPYIVLSDKLASNAARQIEVDLRQSVELTAHPEADRTNIPEEYASWWVRLWLRLLGGLPLLKIYI